MASIIYNSFKKEVMDGTHDMVNGTYKAMLVTNVYVEDKDAHSKRSDVEANEAAGTNYPAGGAALTTPTVVQNNTTDKGVFDADPVVFSNSSVTAAGAVVYKSNGGASSADELVAYIDFAGDETSDAGDFTITWDAAGIVALG